MAKRMQHCFWCGEELGVYDAYPGDLDSCGKIECERETRYAQQVKDADAQNRAREDDCDRYR